MSVVRAGQQSYEIQYSEDNRGLEFDSDGFMYPISIASNDPYTGGWSVRQSGTAGEGWGMTIPQSDDVRGAFTVSHSMLSANSYLLRLDKYNQASAGLGVLWMEDEFRWDLYIDGAKIQEYSFFDSPSWEFLQRDTPCSFGFHCVGGTRFVFTIDGNAVIDYTDAGVPDNIEAVWIGKGTWNAYLLVDDFYVDIVAGESITVPPTYRFIPSSVNADGSSQDWASSVAPADDYTAVDDAVVDDDVTYVYTPSTNSPEDFNTTNITLPVDHTIVAAIVVALARKGDAATASQIRLRAYDGSYADGADQDLPTWYTELWERFLLDPSSAGWLESTFNAAEFGVQSRGTV